MPQSLVAAWGEDLKHLIGPVEAFAAVTARLVWHEFVVGQKCIHFIDNYTVQDALIKGSSSSSVLCSLLVAYEELELGGHSWTWYSRVPSTSNVSDEPSRACGSGIISKLGAVRDSCTCPLTGVDLENLILT